MFYFHGLDIVNDGTPSIVSECYFGLQVGYNEYKNTNILKLTYVPLVRRHVPHQENDRTLVLLLDYAHPITKLIYL